MGELPSSLTLDTFDPSPRQDGDFSEQRFREVINAAFANDIGNLLNRTLGLLKKNSGGVIGVASESMPPNHPLRSLVEQSAPRIAAAYEAFRFTIACDTILAIASRGNQYLEETTPWRSFKKVLSLTHDRLAYDMSLSGNGE